MRRAYVDVSHFRSPYDAPGLQLTGLGAAVIPALWPGGRSYYDVSRFRAPYQDGYFQNNQLFGLGAGEAITEDDSSLLRKAELFKVFVVGIAVGAVGMWIVKRGS